MEAGEVLAREQMQTLPDHTQLPDEDGAIVYNFHEHPQANLLTECLLPRLCQVYPDGQFCIGADSGIYWRNTMPPLEGCKAPDWFLVPGVPPMLEGKVRRSYVLWQEVVKPLLVIEFVSGDGGEERDRTPFQGKFWVYEQGICAAFYAIYEVNKASVEVHCLEMGRYRLLPANTSGRYPIAPLGIELGIWEGVYRQMHLPWLRAWDSHTRQPLPLAEERADLAEDMLDDYRQMLQQAGEQLSSERNRANDLQRLADAERTRADSAEEQLRQLLEKLRQLGIDPGT